MGEDEAKKKLPAIFVFTTAYDPFIGGAEVAIKEVAKRLKGEFRFFVFTSRFDLNAPRLETRDGIIIRRIGLGSRYDKFLLPFLGLAVARLYARKERPALLWAVMASYAAGIPYLMNILRLGKPLPIVLTLQEGDSIEHIRSAKLGLIGFSWRKALRRTHYLTAISSFLLNLGKDFGYCGEGSVIPNGVDVSVFAREYLPDELRILRDGLGIEQDEKVVITTSRLVEKNAVDTAIRAIAVLTRKRRRIKFLILGSGQNERMLRELVGREGIAEKVLFVGAVPHAEIPKYLKIADVFVRPSRSEGLGNSFIEAMAAGIPVIGTNVGGIVDFLENGKTGLMVKVDDAVGLSEAIEKILENQALAEALIEGGRRVALASYQWEMIAGRYASVFAAVISEYAKPLILIATGLYPPDIGGPATYSKILADTLPGRGFRIDVVNFGSVRMLPKGIRHAAYFWKLLTRSRSADIIFAQDPVSVGVPSAVAARILGKRFMLKVVGDYAWEQAIQRFGVSDLLDDFLKRSYGIRVLAFRKLQTFSANSAERIIVPSGYLKTVVEHWGADPGKIRVVYNSFEPGVFTPLERRRLCRRYSSEIADESLMLPSASREAPVLTGFTMSREEIRKTLGFSGIIAVSAGRLVPWKGFDALVESVPEISKSIPDFKLVIIGVGPEETRLKLMVKAAGLEDRIHFTGKIPQSDMLKYLAAGDIFVLNTGYEGFSHTILEAMAMGIPVVTTNVGGNPEVIKSGENGILVPYNDRVALVGAVVRIYRDRPFRDVLVANAQKALLAFTKEKMIRETVDIIRYICI